MRTPTAAAAALVASLTIPSSAVPQASPAPGPGTRVRITAPALGLPGRAGTLVDTAGGVWTFKGDRWPSARELDPGGIAEVEIATGSHRHVAKGALIGLATGVGLGALSGFLEGDDPPCAELDWSGADPGMAGIAILGAFAYSLGCSMRMTAEEKAAMGAVGGGLGGLIAGAVLGALIRTYDWAPAGTPRSTTGASSRGASLQGTFRADGSLGLGLRIPVR